MNPNLSRLGEAFHEFMVSQGFKIKEIIDVDKKEETMAEEEDNAEE